MNEYDVTTIRSLREFARDVIKNYLEQARPAQARLITLSGDLGAGKTTFTQTLGELLEISSGIDSPTYVIEQRYPIESHASINELVHIDAYRLEQENDPQKIGLDQTLQDPTKLIVIEWPEKIEGFLQAYKKIEIVLELSGEKRVAMIK